MPKLPLNVESAIEITDSGLANTTPLTVVMLENEVEMIEREPGVDNKIGASMLEKRHPKMELLAPWTRIGTSVRLEKTQFVKLRLLYAFMKVDDRSR